MMKMRQLLPIVAIILAATAAHETFAAFIGARTAMQRLGTTALRTGLHTPGQPMPVVPGSRICPTGLHPLARRAFSTSGGARTGGYTSGSRAGSGSRADRQAPFGDYTPFVAGGAAALALGAGLGLRERDMIQAAEKDVHALIDKLAKGEIKFNSNDYKDLERFLFSEDPAAYQHLTDAFLANLPASFENKVFLDLVTLHLPAKHITQIRQKVAAELAKEKNKKAHDALLRLTIEHFPELYHDGPLAQYLVANKDKIVTKDNMQMLEKFMQKNHSSLDVTIAIMQHAADVPGAEKVILGPFIGNRESPSPVIDLQDQSTKGFPVIQYLTASVADDKEFLKITDTLRHTFKRYSSLKGLSVVDGRYLTENGPANKAVSFISYVGLMSPWQYCHTNYKSIRYEDFLSRYIPLKLETSSAEELMELLNELKQGKGYHFIKYELKETLDEKPSLMRTLTARSRANSALKDAYNAYGIDL